MIAGKYNYWEDAVARMAAIYLLFWLPVTLYLAAVFVYLEGNENFTTQIVKEGLTLGQGFGHWFLEAGTVTARAMLFWAVVFLAYSLSDRWKLKADSQNATYLILPLAGTVAAEVSLLDILILYAIGVLLTWGILVLASQIAARRSKEEGP